MYRTHLLVWYPDLSYTRRNRTWTPLDVNIGTWNSALIGGLLHGFGRTVGIKSTSAWIWHSALPGKRLTRHTIACCSGSYLARPKECLIFAFAVFFGTGILITTWVANNWSEKFAITLRLMEILEENKNAYKWDSKQLIQINIARDNVHDPKRY